MCARQYLERQKISTPGPKLVSCAGYLASRLSAEFRLLITPLMFNHSGLSGARQTLDAYRTYQGNSWISFWNAIFEFGSPLLLEVLSWVIARHLICALLHKPIFIPVYTEVTFQENPLIDFGCAGVRADQKFM